MNRAYAAIELWKNSAAYMRVEGKVTFTVSMIDKPLMIRARQAIKRGFGTASQGNTHRLLNLLAKHCGYNEHGFPYNSHGILCLYAPRAAADDYDEVADTLEALMNLQGAFSRAAFRNKEALLMSGQTYITGEKRTVLRKYLKEQAAKWMIFRQPMLDFLDDPSNGIRWEFDSDYKGESK